MAAWSNVFPATGCWRCSACRCRAPKPRKSRRTPSREAGLPEIHVGIGIQSGDLVGCSLGSLERQQYTTMGDTTNTAARLVNVAKDVMKAQAASGQGAGKGEDRGVCVVIGRATRGLVAEQFALHPLGAVELKGKHRRTECFAVETTPVAGFAPASGFATGAKYG